jgi:radical SAM superfamily enzyme YgiQ (UPF0313 family)
MEASQVRALMEVPEAKDVYVLGCFENRVTLFSQQARALNLVYALSAQGVLNSNTRLAVIGGGAAGLTAASAAALIGCRTVDVFERHTNVLHVFRGNDTRYIHPHIYDWPLPGWNSLDAGLPILNWKAGIASQVALEIRRGFGILDARLSNLNVNRSIQGLTISKTSKGDWSLRWDLPAFGARAFDVIIIAVGFGVEPAMWNGVKTVRYWQNDDLHQPQEESSRILISGCGDGGLVDLLRLRITDFRHDHVHLDFLGHPSLEKIQEVVCELEKNAAIDRENEFQYLNEGYLGLDAADFDDIIRRRLRRDTYVGLHGRAEYPLSDKACALNRFMVSSLFRVNDVPYYYSQIEKIDLKGEREYEVYFSDRMERFSRIIVRHGPIPAISGNLEWIGKNWKKKHSNGEDLEKVRQPLYPEDFLRGANDLSSSWGPYLVGGGFELSVTPASSSKGLLVSQSDAAQEGLPMERDLPPRSISGSRYPRVIIVKCAIKYPIKDYDFGVPLGPWALRSYLRREGIDAEVYDERLNLKRGEGMDFSEAIDGYDIVGFSICSCEVPEAMRLAAVAKKKGKITVFGGIFVSTNHEYLLSHSLVDYVIPGVATQPLVALVQGLTELRRRITDVPGVYCKENAPDSGALAVWDTGTISSIDFNTLDEMVDRYAPFLDGKIDIVTARGCPYKCEFCSIQRESQRKHTARNDSEVVEEILYLARRRFAKISIKDEIFPILKARAASLLESASKRLEVEGCGVEFKIKSRVDMLMREKESLRDYHRWGVREIQFGIEAVNPQMLNMIHKGYEPETDALRDFLEYVADLGIVVNASFILGIEGESVKYYDGLIKFVRSLGHLERFKVYVNFYTPHPMLSRWTVPAKSRLLIDDLRCFTHKIPLVCPSTLTSRSHRAAMLDTYDQIVALTKAERYNPAISSELRERFIGGNVDLSSGSLPRFESGV